ncbi:hypothetical protein BJ170DRAFT_602873 [Xylariales sp. AK1849]|nr:hypothetical protein BJ170DRAFT_602873 [Xylariales sp. AK1849]
MGLAGQKNRRKLAEDPNNTKWSRDSTNFGQKILRAHGWEPGQFLGAQDASHAVLHSAASSAPIKVLLKDDTVGLGAKIRHKQSDQCTGLDVFKDLLGRLNGKSTEAIEQERAIRSELKTSHYVERKYGPMRFVKGGLLVGDQVTELLKKGTAAQSSTSKEASAVIVTADDHESKKYKKEKKTKKRRAEEIDSLEDPKTNQAEKKKKRKRCLEEDSPPGSITLNAVADESKKERKKKDKRDRKSKRLEVEDGVEANEAKSKPKKDKKSKKRKDTKLSHAGEPKDGDDLKAIASEDSEQAKRKKKRKHLGTPETPTDDSSQVSVVEPVRESGTSTPAEIGTATPQLMARHMVRSRNIASKRLAIADMQALNQIFMVKPV